MVFNVAMVIWSWTVASPPLLSNIVRFDFSILNCFLLHLLSSSTEKLNASAQHKANFDSNSVIWILNSNGSLQMEHKRHNEMILVPRKMVKRNFILVNNQNVFGFICIRFLFDTWYKDCEWQKRLTIVLYDNLCCHCCYVPIFKFIEMNAQIIFEFILGWENFVFLENFNIERKIRFNL